MLLLIDKSYYLKKFIDFLSHINNIFNLNEFSDSEM